MRYAVEILKEDRTWHRIFGFYTLEEAQYQFKYERNRDPLRLVRIVEIDE